MDRVSLRGDENILDMDSGDGFTKVGMYLRPLKIVNKIVNIKLNFIFYVEVKLINNIVIVSGTQQSDPAIHAPILSWLWFLCNCFNQ